MNTQQSFVSALKVFAFITDVGLNWEQAQYHAHNIEEAEKQVWGPLYWEMAVSGTTLLLATAIVSAMRYRWFSWCNCSRAFCACCCTKNGQDTCNACCRKRSANDPKPKAHVEIANLLFSGATMAFSLSVIVLTTVELTSPANNMVPSNLKYIMLLTNAVTFALALADTRLESESEKDKESDKEKEDSHKP